MLKYDAIDCGAQGNCGYLCLAMAFGLERGEDVETLKSSIPARAVTIRHDLLTRMKKGQNEYSDCFSFKVIGNAEQEGGDVPDDWDSWLSCTLRDGRWIDGLSLKAASRRYGICIAVVPKSGRADDVPVRFRQPRSGKAPVFLLLKDGHYQLGKLKAGKQWPQAWLQAQEAAVEIAMWRAGCEKSFPSLPGGGASAVSWRPAVALSRSKGSNAFVRKDRPKMVCAEKWVTDLVEDGGIEPNPGLDGSSSRSPKTLRLLCALGNHFRPPPQLAPWMR